MVEETLGDAFAAGWRITARCVWGKREGMKSRRECQYTRTRGPTFPAVEPGRPADVSALSIAGMW